MGGVSELIFDETNVGNELGKAHDGAGPADALVLFGATGDLAHKKIFPALYAMAKLRGESASRQCSCGSANSYESPAVTPPLLNDRPKGQCSLPPILQHPNGRLGSRWLRRALWRSRVDLAGWVSYDGEPWRPDLGSP
jgi:hypothetical protein